MDTSYYNSQSTIQKELNAKYQIASKELQNLYKRSIMIEPLLKILEDIYPKENEGSIALVNNIKQIKGLNADIKTCLLNVKEKKSGPFQRIVKSKGENFDALESQMDKFVKDLETSLIEAENAAKDEKKKLNNANQYPQNNYSNGNQQMEQPTKYSLTDNYYSYNNNALNNINPNYKEPANYNYNNDQNNHNNNNNNNNYDKANLSGQFSYLNINDNSNDKSSNQIIQDNINKQNNNYNNMDYYNNQNSNAQPVMNMQPPNYQQSFSQDQMNNNQFYNNYSSPSQQYYYGTLTKTEQQQQQNMNNFNPNNSYQDMNSFQNSSGYNNQYKQQNQQIQYPSQMQQLQQQQQQLQQQQLQQQQIQQQQIQQQIHQQMQNQQLVTSQNIDGSNMENESLINQKGLIPPTPYYAISQFTPRQPDELAIEQGDEVIIVQTFDDGWAFGRNSRTRMVGVLPMTFLSYNNQFGNNYQYSELPDRQSSRRL